MATQREIITDIHIKVVKMEEHMKAQNDKVFSNTKNIKEIQDKLPNLTMWNKLQTAAVGVLMGVCGYLLKAVVV